jgi:hypothetical protein
MSVYTEEDMTPWFPGSVAPEREGVYERRYYGDDEDVNNARFDVGFWYCGRVSIEGALTERDRSLYQTNLDDGYFEWRGLAQNPNVVTITPEVAVVKCNVPGLALDSGEFIPAAELNAQAAVDDEEDLF